RRQFSSLFPRRRSGERGNPRESALLSPALSLGGRRESSGLCARIAPCNLTRALLAGLDHKRMPALISNDLRVSKMGGYWAGGSRTESTGQPCRAEPPSLEAASC